MYLNIKTLDIVCLTGLLTLALGGSIVLAGTAMARTKESVSRDKVRSLRLAELLKAEQVKSDIDAGLRTHRPAFVAIQQRLTKSRNIGEFIADLDRIALRRKVDLDRVDPGAKREDVGYHRTTVSFACRGSFIDLHAVLCDLELMPRLLRIESVDMNRSSLADDCSMNVSCCVYGATPEREAGR